MILILYFSDMYYPVIKIWLNTDGRVIVKQIRNWPGNSILHGSIYWPTRHCSVIHVTCFSQSDTVLRHTWRALANQTLFCDTRDVLKPTRHCSVIHVTCFSQLDTVFWTMTHVTYFSQLHSVLWYTVVCDPCETEMIIQTKTQNWVEWIVLAGVSFPKTNGNYIDLNNRWWRVLKQKQTWSVYKGPLEIW